MPMEVEEEQKTNPNNVGVEAGKMPTSWHYIYNVYVTTLTVTVHLPVIINGNDGPITFIDCMSMTTERRGILPSFMTDHQIYWKIR